MIISRATVKSKSAFLKRTGKKIVFTNGCFDILHQGHTTYLKGARALGDFLIVGLNSDESVTALKGENRPINNETSRLKNLLNLPFVDFVTVFSELTPKLLIDEIRPDILVKGGDYNADEIIGADRVKADGGKVITLPLVSGFSTTKILENASEKGLTDRDNTD